MKKINLYVTTPDGIVRHLTSFLGATIAVALNPEERAKVKSGEILLREKDGDICSLDTKANEGFHLQLVIPKRS